MRRPHQARGFTILETTIALAVMMVVGLGATSLFLYAVRYNSGATDRTMEMAILQQRMELYRSVPFNSPQLNAQAKTSTIVNTTPSSPSAPTAAAAAPQSGVQSSPTTGVAGDSRAYDLDTTIQDVTTYAGGPVMQKLITLTVAPRSVRGTSDWRNTPMTVIIRRSSPALGPYRQ